MPDLASAKEFKKSCSSHLGNREQSEAFSQLARELAGRLTGRWLADRGWIIALYSRDGVFSGDVVASPRPNDVGRWALLDVALDTATGDGALWRGLIFTTEAGKADVTIRAIDADTLELFVTKGDFVKTLRWTRERAR